jgi:hypothetical protein
MVLAGLSKAQMVAELKAAYHKKEVPPLEPGSIFLLAVFQGSPEPINVFIVPTRRWSDGTPQ